MLAPLRSRMPSFKDSAEPFFRGSKSPALGRSDKRARQRFRLAHETRDHYQHDRRIKSRQPSHNRLLPEAALRHQRVTHDTRHTLLGNISRPHPWLHTNHGHLSGRGLSAILSAIAEIATSASAGVWNKVARRRQWAKDK
jgi:hypothetical protein